MADAKTVKLELKLDEQLLRRIGLRAVEMIVERTQQENLDASGNAFAPYSTRPFAMPVGGGARTAIGRLVKGGLAEYFTTKKGTLWAIITGGYAAYKRERYGQDGGRVNLTATGSMMRAVRIVAISGSTVTIGFARDEEAQKAAFVQKRRVFMGLTADQQTELARVAGEGATIQVR